MTMIDYGGVYDRRRLHRKNEYKLHYNMIYYYYVILIGRRRNILYKVYKYRKPCIRVGYNNIYEIRQQ